MMAVMMGCHGEACREVKLEADGGNLADERIIVDWIYV